MEITKNKIEAQNFYTISISQFFPPLDKKLDADDVCVSKKLLKYLYSGHKYTAIDSDIVFSNFSCMILNPNNSFQFEL